VSSVSSVSSIERILHLTSFRLKTATLHKAIFEAMPDFGGGVNESYRGRARNGVERFFKKIKRCRRIVQPCEGYDDPAVGAILTLAGAQDSATEERCARHREECNRKSIQGGWGEEGGQLAPAEDDAPEIGLGASPG
jgi:hypothetical protein